MGLAFQMAADLDACLRQFIFQDSFCIAGTFLDGKRQQQRIIALDQAAGKGKANSPGHHV